MSSIPAIGVSNFTIASISFDVADDFTWSPNILANTELSGMTGALQGIGQEPKAAVIETTVRNTGNLPISFFAGINGEPVAATFRDGTLIVAANAVWIGDELTCSQKDGTVKLKFAAQDADPSMIDEDIEPIPPTKTWTLHPAIHLGNKEYDSIVMRAPTMNEVELSEAESTPIKQLKKLVQLISGLPAAAVEKTPFYILREAYTYTQSFTSEAVAAYYAKAS